MTRTALILGTTGRFGRSMETAFTSAGWTTRKFDRATDELARSAKGVDVIVFGWNPTYDKWAAQVPIQTKNIIAAAKANNATVLIPGNVYVYGKSSPEIWRESTPHAATNPLGQIRVTLEQAFENSGVKSILLRGGDFLDTEPSGNWFDRIICKNLARGIFSYPGNPNIAHSWAYLPDFCRAFVQLAEKRANLPEFTTLNFEGYTLTGTEMARVLGVKPKQMSWLPVLLALPFWPLARHLTEMRYLWNKPHQMDGHALRAILPDFRETPIPEAVAAAASFQINPDKPMIGTRATI